MKIVSSFLTSLVVAVALASCTPPGGQQGKGGAQGGIFGPQVFILIAMVFVFWMFFIRPQAKRAKNQKKFIEDLGKGDKVVTIAGIHGVINKVNEDGTLNIEVSPGSYMKIEKSAISMDWTANINKPVAVTGDKK